MGGFVVKLGILTSSRADFGVYLPLLKAIEDDASFELHILVFGSHLSEKFGYTVNQIESEGFKISHHFITAPANDRPIDICKSMATTIMSFSSLWELEAYDLLIVLGDRYEMFAAVSSTVPFNIPVAHIHGGETTLGAIDNSFRHCITSMSKYHFTTCEEYRKRVTEILGSNEGVYNVGALSIDALSVMQFLSIEEFYLKYQIDLSKPTILFTFHPETVTYKKNEEYIKILIEVLDELKIKYQIVITMPNADTAGDIIRNNLSSFIMANPRTWGIESFGSLDYLSCMKHCSFMLGNTSSGFVEASYFGKPVINLGDRQKGRILTPNIFSIPVNVKNILDTVRIIEQKSDFEDCQIYGDGKAAEKIIEIMKSIDLN